MEKKRNSRPRKGPTTTKKPRRRPQGQASMGGPGNKVSAYVASQITSNNSNLFRFGAASPHDDYPEGGLRIAGRLVSTYSDAVTTPTTASGTTGGFGTSGGLTCMGISPAAWITGTYVYPSAVSGQTGGFMYYVSRYFRKFRFRQLTLVYEGTTATTTNGAVQLSYDPDVLSAMANMNVAAPSQAANATSRSIRFPLWTPQARLECIGERKHDGADKLFQSLSGSIALSSLGSADATIAFQGAVSCLMDITSTVATLVGHFSWEFVLDLYGFSNSPTTAPFQAVRPLEEQKTKQPTLRVEELKAESSDSELVDIPPVPLKRRFVEPSQDQGLTPANTPAGSKNSVRSLSLK